VQIGGAAWDGVKSGVTKASEAAVLGTIAGLAYQILGPVAALAFLFKSFGPIKEAAKLLQESGEIPGGSENEEAARDAGPPEDDASPSST